MASLGEKDPPQPDFWQQLVAYAQRDRPALSLFGEYGTLRHLNLVHLQTDLAKIKAEISGRVGRAQLTEGNLVNAGGSDPLLTTIVAVNPINVYFNIDERSLQRYQK